MCPTARLPLDHVPMGRLLPKDYATPRSIAPSIASGPGGAEPGSARPGTARARRRTGSRQAGTRTTVEGINVGAAFLAVW